MECFCIQRCVMKAGLISVSLNITTMNSTVSSSVVIVTFSYQLFAIRYIVTIEQYNTGGSGWQQKVVSSNQTTLTTTFTSLSKYICSALSRNLRFLGIPRKPAILSRMARFLQKAQRFLQKAHAVHKKRKEFALSMDSKAVQHRDFCTVSSVPCTHSPSF